jgi:membrane fusion protein, multidrug efflux system
MSADGGTPSAPGQAAAPSSFTPEAPPPKPRKRNFRRYLIMAAVPLVLIAVGGYFWLSGGRYVSTDNAYVQRDRVTVTAQVSGIISEVDVSTNQTVKKGQVLFRIDSEPYKIALDQADAALASARLQVDQLRATYQQALAALKAARDNNDFQTKNLQRQQELLAKGVSTQANFDSAQNDARAAEQALLQAKQNVAAALSALGGNPQIKTDKHPLVLAALARREQAALNLKNTTVVAPADGVVAQADRLQVGQYVTNPTGNPTALLSLVETGSTWIDANFKETELADMHPGEKATVSIDAYPGKTFKATVASIGAGTGSEFSLLPAQNATGNWVKVVQRVPVRIRLDNPDPGVAMRIGLSAYVTVDTQSAPTQTAAK